jgi:hypothetical protein
MSSIVHLVSLKISYCQYSNLLVIYFKFICVKPTLKSSMGHSSGIHISSSVFSMVRFGSLKISCRKYGNYTLIYILFTEKLALKSSIGHCTVCVSATLSNLDCKMTCSSDSEDKLIWGTGGGHLLAFLDGAGGLGAAVVGGGGGELIGGGGAGPFVRDLLALGAGTGGAKIWSQ